MVITSPVKATMNPAPVFGTNSWIVISKPSGAPKSVGLSEKLTMRFWMNVSGPHDLGRGLKALLYSCFVAGTNLGEATSHRSTSTTVLIQ